MLYGSSCFSTDGSSMEIKQKIIQCGAACDLVGRFIMFDRSLMVTCLNYRQGRENSIGKSAGDFLAAWSPIFCSLSVKSLPCSRFCLCLFIAFLLFLLNLSLVCIFCLCLFCSLSDDEPCPRDTIWWCLCLFCMH